MQKIDNDYGVCINCRKQQDMPCREGFLRLSFVTPPSVLPDISPSRGEICSFAGSAFYPIGDWRNRARRLISPLEGVMSGRTEGGAKERNVDNHGADHPHELG